MRQPQGVTKYVYPLFMYTLFLKIKILPIMKKVKNVVLLSWKEYVNLALLTYVEHPQSGKGIKKRRIRTENGLKKS